MVLLSATEGDDKPAKYPVMFRAADLVLLSKMDLAAVLDDFEPQRAEQAVRALANAAPVIPLSARKGVNLDLWVAWLRQELAKIRATQETAHHAHEAHHEHHHHHDQPAVA